MITGKDFDVKRPKWLWFMSSLVLAVSVEMMSRLRTTIHGYTNS